MHSCAHHCGKFEASRMAKKQLVMGEGQFYGIPLYWCLTVVIMHVAPPSAQSAV